MDRKLILGIPTHTDVGDCNDAATPCWANTRCESPLLGVPWEETDVTTADGIINGNSKDGDI